MRDLPIQAPLLVAALLAFAMLAPPALAFDIDTSGGSMSDGAARYGDPDDAPLPGSLGAVTVTPGARFGGGAAPASPTSIPQSWQELDWANPLPDRRAK